MVTSPLTRLRQVLALRRATVPVVPPELERLFNDKSKLRFQLLPPFEQSHLIAVANWLANQDASVELVTAGLLHDIGKANSGATITLIDRAAYTVLPSFISKWISSKTWQSRLLPGFAILANHAQAGASLVQQWGYPDRVAWLIVHHEDKQPSDRELALLLEADSQCISTSK